MLTKIDPDYLAWVRSQPCVGYGECGGMVCAHHVTGRGMGGSKRDDRDAVSLCLKHHKEYHDTGSLSPWNHKETVALLIEAAHKLLKEYLDGLHGKIDK